MRVVDLLLEHAVPFEDLWVRSQEVNLSLTIIRIASIEDLIELKRQAGQPQDLADIEHLEAILRAEKKRIA